MKNEYMMLGRIDAGSVVRDGSGTSATLMLYGNHADELKALEEQELDIMLKRHREKRSTKANNLCWELCSQIGNAISPPIPKEEVYRRAIRDVGVFIQVAVRKGDYKAFDRQWRARGTGWFTEITDTHDYMDVVDVMAYCGSSTYDTKAMSTLIDYLIDEAEQMELTIAYSLKEIEQIKEDWKSAFDKEKGA